MANSKSRRVRVGDVLIANQDSMSLGLDSGMKMSVVWVKDGKMDVDVPALDMRISGIRTDHPDLSRAAPIASAASSALHRHVMGIDSLRIGSGKTKAQLDSEIKASIGKRRR